MWRYLFRKNRLIWAYLFVAPLSAACSVAVAAGTSAAIDYALGGTLDDIWSYVIAFSLYVLLDLLVDQVYKNLRYRLIKRTMVQLRADLYHHIAYMDSTRFGSRNTADYIAALTSDANLLRDSYFEVFLALYVDLLRFLLAASYLFYLSPLLGCFVLLTSAVQALVPVVFSRRQETAGANFSRAQQRHMVTLKENFSAFLTAKVFHGEARLERSYRTALEDAEEQKRVLLTRRTTASNVSFMLSRVAQFGVFLLGAVLAIGGQLSTASIVAASQLIIYISNPIYWLNKYLTELNSVKAPARKLAAILTQPADLGGEITLDTGVGTLEVQGLRFSYGDRHILNDISCRFEAGGKYLITGGSGSGKSTLLNLLGGLRQDYGGHIRLRGTELRDLSRKSLTEHICYLDQSPFLFDDTLYHNICLFSPASEPEVLRLLHRVGLGPYLETLPKGLHTRIGEGASVMSGGEKQRVALARALLSGARVLLLDECTCHLDPQTAASIEELMLTLEGVTVLLVSHNATPAARARADAVLEMKDGQLKS